MFHGILNLDQPYNIFIASFSWSPPYFILYCLLLRTCWTRHLVISVLISYTILLTWLQLTAKVLRYKINYFHLPPLWLVSNFSLSLSPSMVLFKSSSRDSNFSDDILFHIDHVTLRPGAGLLLTFEQKLGTLHNFPVMTTSLSASHVT